ncbi:MAG: histidine phosphatase family protein [Clostridiales bacterium]|nr:histidine phosphatase family protein [Clostridiales bacterium]
MKSYLIYLIRNGRTDPAFDGKYIGHTDITLSGDGREELEKLREEFEYPEPEIVFSSPLKRCTETAEIVFPGVKTIKMDGLIEYDFGEFEGKTAEELSDHPVFPSWLAGEEGVDAPFGESNEKFQKRVCACFGMIVEGMMKTGTLRAGMVTHGGVMATVLAAFGLPEAPMHEWMTDNGYGYALRITPSLWMRGAKVEVYEKLPIVPRDSYDDPDDDGDFNVEDFLYD